MGDVEYMHEAEVAADIDNIGYGPLVVFAQFKQIHPVYAPVDVDAKDWQTESEEVNEHEQPQLEHPGEQTQVGKAEQDECPDGRVVRRPEDGGKDVGYEKNLFHLPFNHLTIDHFGAVTNFSLFTL